MVIAAVAEVGHTFVTVFGLQSTKSEVFKVGQFKREAKRMKVKKITLVIKR